ncbi:hypothetical protein FDJ23_gp117 [Erwinia phage vB_EamM_Desertfox]|uniref:Uncharacterized protein n=5 Tax=Agricanvirus TaxID=1984776 RepID=A0A482ICW5_9CAUD|nr:hypothetical protein FDH97_gp122 [Erwinia phage vB_EamM_Deimos-Minion]YP_009621858.1 hypothetical protein FDJ23_gp117 [Erwinia phage vB_EamM_Desertfox]AUG85905.1 hypothetical protein BOSOLAPHORUS_118 [Erwinia phage vB_EamM_Bosolaphorus]AUG86546.1 hypothetical protein MADMEL_118 [Erwinia phage vB_EamM_MadMel]QBP07225.1 hypothetical protein REBECCA_118 [Erwinia phage Rebecca]ANH52220.1 hypothetical protein DM_122 [Erwinia phage vB_EamM_Deimos-Minion]AUG86224.1 hypothetical protein DESERTFOX_
MDHNTALCTLNPKVLIQNELYRFIRLYALFNGLDVHDVKAITKKINSGDCGLAAITVHHLLKEKYKLDTDILMCRNHCWLAYHEGEYDTAFPSGYTKRVVEVWDGSPDEPVHYLTFQEACDEWMPMDVKGAYIVKAFCAITWTQFPKELQHCLDNADEYEMPGIAAQYEAKCKFVTDNM